jgi:branched-chain amino acid transport system permease protein
MNPAGARLRDLLTLGLPAVALLAVMPFVATPYQTVLLSYGLVYAIAALGFNLLLGYTGLLSFGHCAYFGVGAYAVAFMVKYFKWSSMELFVLGGVVASAFVSLIFGFLCVRYTRIFFGILTMALSQVLWSLAFKFFWFTGGSDGLRVPTPTLLGGVWAQGPGSDKFDFLSHRYYFYVLALFVAAVAVMWLIVHSPFGKALQAIRDNETRAEFVGVQVRRYRLVAFVVSGIYTGLAGALWVPLNGLTTPDILHWTFSGKIVFFTVLGGFQTFAGPIIGAIAFNYLEVYAVGHTVYWQLVLGVVLVALVLVPAGGDRGQPPAVAAAAAEDGRMSLLETRQLAKSLARPMRSIAWTSASTRARSSPSSAPTGRGRPRW